MKKIFSMLLLSCLVASPLTSCMGDEDDPNTDGYIITSPTSVGKVNVTIGEIKDKYCASANGADYSRNRSNFFSKVNDSLVIEGVVVANDQGGNLYQTLMIRNINGERDEAILMKVKNTCLYPYFSLGQRLKINLKGLYVGCYSKTPSIGQPYYSSKGNLNLGPVLLQMCATNVELVGQPKLDSPELIPLESVNGQPLAEWLKSEKNKSYKNVPILVKVSGKIDEVQGNKATRREEGTNSGKKEPLPKIFAPDELYDDGFGVDRTLILDANNHKMALRTSTQNPIAFLPIPTDSREYTGMLNYYFDWQIQLRSVKDIYPEVTYNTLSK